MAVVTTLDQPDLFAAPPMLVPGLSLDLDFLSRVEENRVIGLIDALDLAPFRFQGWLGRRLTASFAWSYDFDSGRFGAAAPIPDSLLAIRGRAAAHTGITPDDLVQALVTRYDPGAGIGWHKDRPQFDHVVGISLGNPTTLRLRRRDGPSFERRNVPLPARSIYRLQGAVRHDWEHSIAPMSAPRWSITFRSLSDKGRKLAQTFPRER